MGYLGLNPNLKAYKSSVYIASSGDTELPLTIDVECLVIKNGVILTPEYDFYRNPNTNKVNLTTPAEQGDEFYLINLSTFSFNGLVTKDELEKKLNEVQSPLFTVMWFPSRDSITGGFVPADGQPELRSMYPDAFTGIESALVPVVADADWLSTPAKRASYTTGDGSTTFRLPDYNGKSSGGSAAVVLRGDGLNADTAGNIQSDAIRNITGGFSDAPVVVNRTEPQTVQEGALSYTSFDTLGHIPWTTNSQSKLLKLMKFDSSRVVPTAPENRMVNTAGVWCIRLAHQIIQQGIITAKGVIDSINQTVDRVIALEDSTPRMLYVAPRWKDDSARKFVLIGRFKLEQFGTTIRLDLTGGAGYNKDRRDQCSTHTVILRSGNNNPKGISAVYECLTGSPLFDDCFQLDVGDDWYEVYGRLTNIYSRNVICTASNTRGTEIDYTSILTDDKRFDAIPSNAQMMFVKGVWIPLPLVNGWVAYDADHGVPAYMHRGEHVYFKSVIKNGTSHAFASMPDHLRPLHRYSCIAGCSPNTYLRVVVEKNGNVSYNTASGAAPVQAPSSWITLDTVSYVVAPFMG